MTTVTLETPITGAYEQPTGLFINNKFVKGVEGRTFETINPTTEEVIASVHEATEADVDIAVAAAREAFEGAWKQVTPEQRGRCLVKLAELLEEHADTLAAIEALDNGKAFTLAKGDIACAASKLRYYGGWADKIEGKVIDTNRQSFNYTKREPVGVCGQIIPWNYPILMWSWKIGPAVATGCTVVLKTAEQTPLSALYAASLIPKAGFPPGTINIISGFGNVAGAAISRHMGIDKVAFTGSTVIGREILQAAAKSNLKKVTLELGGKSPNIVFEDTDIEQAIGWANTGIFFNQGQSCSAGSCIYVQEGIYDKFIKAFTTAALANIVGNPFDEKTFQGPQVSQLQYDRVMAYIESGKQEGAKVEIGGARVEDQSKGYFIQPTIFSNVDPSMKIMREEIFGPGCAIAKFKSVEDVIRMGNDTVYGLAAAVHTNNLDTAIAVADGLRAGTIWVNSYGTSHHQIPFGGFKQSGLGRELGETALDNYTEIKAVSIRLKTTV